MGELPCKDMAAKRTSALMRDLVTLMLCHIINEVPNAAHVTDPTLFECWAVSPKFGELAPRSEGLLKNVTHMQP